MWRIIWDDELGGNVDHIFDHGLTPDDVEFVLGNYESKRASRSSGRPCAFGYTEDGRYILVVYDELDENTIYPVTAYDVPEP
jgi:uncharacterized DUF497 family protein